MKEITISSLDKVGIRRKVLLFGRLDRCRFRSRKSIQSNSTLILVKVQGTGSRANIKGSFSQSKRKTIQGLYSECLGICE